MFNASLHKLSCHKTVSLFILIKSKNIAVILLHCLHVRQFLLTYYYSCSLKLAQEFYENKSSSNQC